MCKYVHHIEVIVNTTIIIIFLLSLWWSMLLLLSICAICQAGGRCWHQTADWESALTKTLQLVTVHCDCNSQGCYQDVYDCYVKWCAGAVMITTDGNWPADNQGHALRATLQIVVSSVVIICYGDTQYRAFFNCYRSSAGDTRWAVACKVMLTMQPSSSLSPPVICCYKICAHAMQEQCWWHQMVIGQQNFNRMLSRKPFELLLISALLPSSASS